MTQKEALDVLKLGRNVYLTGPAGSGKTFVLNEYISYLKENEIIVGITASTGIAATHINGVTIHSWCGLGIRDNLTKEYLKSLSEKDYLVGRLRNAKVLIIDEISMLDANRLDLIDTICRKLKEIDFPFGGLQVIFCGDFFQLPPVDKDGKGGGFAYKANVWDEMNLRICYLHEQHRQSDKRFNKVLNDIRENRADEETANILLERINQSIDSKITPAKLFTHNIDVDAMNSFELEKIQAPASLYTMQSSGPLPLVKSLKSNCLAPEELKLKKMAVVMFVKNNFNLGYINGTIGEVIGFDEENYPIVRTVAGREIIALPTAWTIEEDGLVKARISQVPLRLAWAITVHKSQGMSLDIAEIDLSKSFTTGMGYVALSRVRTLMGIKLIGINALALKVNEEISELDEKFKTMSDDATRELDKLGWREKRRMQKQFIESLKVF